MVVLDDVTEFARLDELRSELVGVASHELKTPLTTLQMNLLLLGERADNLTPRQRQVLQLIAGGHSTKEIAYHLELSVKTVETATTLSATASTNTRRRSDGSDVRLT